MANFATVASIEWIGGSEPVVSSLFLDPPPDVRQTASNVWAHAAERFAAPRRESLLTTEESGRESFAKSLIPFSIVANWERLRRSNLPPDSFDQLVSLTRRREIATKFGLAPIRPNSLSCFLEFWRQASSVSQPPELGASPKGLIQAEWRKNDSDVLIMQFQAEGEILFSFWHDDLATDGSERIEKSRDLIAMLSARSDNPLQWREEG